MRRREFITLLGGSAAMTWTRAARAQQAGPMRLIGVLINFAEGDLSAQPLLAAFRSALSKLGWTEGGNLRIEVRWGAGNPDRIRTLAKELIDLQPDVILGHNTVVVSALARETQTTPIVFTSALDPIGSGFAANLAHPGGHITGFTNNDPAMGGKWVQLLREIAPRTVHVAFLFNPATALPIQSYVPSVQAAARSFAVQASTAPIHTKDEIEGVIAAQARNPGGGLIVPPDVSNVVNRELIIALAAHYNVPAIYGDRLFAESGGLIAYGDDRAEEFRHAAGYIDRILKGAKPADLPIQQPTKFELVINLKTAKALGLSLSSGLLSIADEVIE
jgi:putative tryptophan/tyrosine transport system substrate-binding protein